MPRFEVYTCEYVEQGVRYMLTAPNAEEAVRRVMEHDFPEGEEPEVKVMGEDCKKQTLDWAWDEEGNDVTPGQYRRQPANSL